MEFILSGFGDEIDSSLDTQMTVMSKLGIRYIELRGIDGRSIATYTGQEAKALKERMAARGMKASAVGSPIGKIGIKDDYAAHLDVYKNMLDVAEALECRYIRMFSFFYPADEDPALYKDAVMDRLGQLVELAKGRDVKLLHENEKHIYGDVPERCLEILKAYPEIKATYDPSNFVQCDVDNKHAFTMLKPYIEYMHIKDSVYSEKRDSADLSLADISDCHRPAGEGDGNLMWILAELKKMDYVGFMSIEPHLAKYEGVPGDGTAKFTAAYEALRGLIDQL